MNLDHLDAIRARLVNERQRLDQCKPRERAARAHIVAMVERELAGEYQFLGIDAPPAYTGTDEELLNELGIAL